MSSTAKTAREVFVAAVKLAPQEWDAFLTDQCGGDDDLRRRVRSLLSAHEEVGSFLHSPAAPAVTVGEPVGERPGAVIGPYKLLEQIGEGGFGVVFMAEQATPLHRKVALKVIKPGMDTRQVIARFEAERQALALMDHANIAHVLDAGETDSGRPYFVMELIRGIPITEYCDKHQLTPRARLELFLSVCQAVQHAHQKGIIHRDLKPSNVLVTLHDGTPVVKIIDFGIAKATGQKLTDKTLFTNFAHMIGTPLYMSPEQAEMSGMDIDTRSDIYSLGVLLYELLTGTTPFDKQRLKNAAFDEIRRIIREEEAVRPSTRMNTLWETSASNSANRKSDPRKLSQLFRGELDWIVMKALDKDRRRRYETANGMARDIEHYLHDEPVEACPPSALYRFGKFTRRHKVAFTTVSMVLVALIVGIVISTWQAIRATHAEDWAEQGWEAEKTERTRAVHAEHEERDAKVLAQRRLFDARLAEARAGRRSKQVGQRIDSLKALQEATDLARKLEMAPSAWMALRNEAIACLGLTDFRKVHEQDVRIPYLTDYAAFDPTLEHYAVGDDRGLLLIRCTDNNQEAARLQCPGTNDNPATFSPDGKWLLTYRSKGGADWLAVWDWRKSKMVLETERGGFAFSPDSRQAAIGKAKSISVFDLTTGQKVKDVATGIRAEIMAFAPDGIRLAIGNRNSRQIQVYDVTAEKLLRTLPNADTTHDLAWHPNGQTLAVSGDNDECIHVWDVLTGQEQAILRGHHARAWSLGFAADGLLVSTSWDRTVRLWNVTSGQEVFRMRGTFCNWSQDGRRLAVRVDQNVQVWERAETAAYSVLPWTEAPLGTVGFGRALSPDGRWLAVGDSEGLRLFDLAVGKQAAFIPVGPTASALFLPPGNELWTSGPKGLYRWPFRVANDTLHIGPPRKVSGANAGGLATDSRGKSLLLHAGAFGRPAILNLDDLDATPRRLDHSSVGSAAISPDGRWAITGTHNGLGVRIFDVITGKLMRPPLLPENRMTRVGIHPNGQQFVTMTGQGPELGTIWWEAHSWKELRRVSEYGSCWSPDGRLFAQSPDGRRVRLLDGEGKRALATLEAPDDAQAGLLFTPDGSRLILFTGKPAHIRVWDLRLLRSELAKMGLDWDALPYPPAPTADAKTPPLRVELELVDPIEQAARAQEVQGNQQRTAKEYAEAIACYREVLKSEPHNVGVLNLLAWLLAIGPPEVRDGHEALKLVERVRAWEPAHANVVNTLGAAQYRAGQHAEALRSLRQAEKLFQGNKGFWWPHNWLVQALCHAKLGQLDTTRAMLEKSTQWMKDPGTSNTTYHNEAQLLREEVEMLLKN